MSGEARGPERPPVEIRDAEATLAAALASRVEHGAAARGAGAPPIRIVRFETLAAEVDALRAAIAEVRARLARARSVESDRSGLAGNLELLVKRTVRRLILRHLDLQREVDEALLAALERAVALFARQHDLADENAARIEEHALRQPGAAPPR